MVWFCSHGTGYSGAISCSELSRRSGFKGKDDEFLEMLSRGACGTSRWITSTISNI